MSIGSARARGPARRPRAATPRRVAPGDTALILGCELRVTIEESLLLYVTQSAEPELRSPQCLRRSALGQQFLVETCHQQCGSEVINGPEACYCAGATGGQRCCRDRELRVHQTTHRRLGALASRDDNQAGSKPRNGGQLSRRQETGGETDRRFAGIEQSSPSVAREMEVARLWGVPLQEVGGGGAPDRTRASPSVKQLGDLLDLRARRRKVSERISKRN